jgi:hypothetical protein
MKLIAGLILLLTITGCASNSAIQFESEEMLESGYSTFKTYAFLPTNDTNYAKLINRQTFVPLLAHTAKAELDKKGLVLDTLHPDCLFTYHLVMNRKYEANQQSVTEYKPQTYAAGTPIYDTYSSSGVSGSSAVRAGTAPYSNVYYFSSNNKPITYSGKMSIDTLREGSMVIDMIDVKSNRIVWRSIAQGKNKESNKADLKTSVEYVIPKMLSKLPRK